MGLRYASAVIMYLQIFGCFLAGIIVAFTAGENVHGMTEIFSIFTIVPISIVIWILFIGPMPTQSAKKVVKITTITAVAFAIISTISLAVAFGVYNAQSGDWGGRDGYTFEYEMTYDGQRVEYYSDSEGYLHAYLNDMSDGRGDTVRVLTKTAEEKFYFDESYSYIYVYNIQDATISYLETSDGMILEFYLTEYYDEYYYMTFTTDDNEHYNIQFGRYSSNIFISQGGSEVSYIRDENNNFCQYVDGEKQIIIKMGETSSVYQ